jgi:hypothetical protein
MAVRPVDAEAPASRIFSFPRAQPPPSTRSSSPIPDFSPGRFSNGAAARLTIPSGIAANIFATALLPDIVTPSVIQFGDSVLSVLNVCSVIKYFVQKWHLPPGG